MAKLNAKKRNALPSSDFAVAGRKYPVNDPNHARDALARVAQHGSPKEKAEVKEKVKSKYPGIGMKKSTGSKSRGREETKPMKRSSGRFAGGHNAITSQEGYCLRADCK
jgi:hypothetical protein